MKPWRYQREPLLQYDYPNFGDWWWNFRVNYFGPQGYVDSNVYSFGTFRSYVNAVYLNGANFLDDLRTRIGDEAFFAFLKDYASQISYGHAQQAPVFLRSCAGTPARISRISSGNISKTIIDENYGSSNRMAVPSG